MQQCRKMKRFTSGTWRKSAMSHPHTFMSDRGEHCKLLPCGGLREPCLRERCSREGSGFSGNICPSRHGLHLLAQRRHDVMSAKGYIAPDQSRLNPRSTPFVSTATSFQGILVCPGDIITSITKVVGKSRRQGDKFITFQVTAHNQRGKMVAQYDYVCLWSTSAEGIPQGCASQDHSRQSQEV